MGERCKKVLAQGGACLRTRMTLRASFLGLIDYAGALALQERLLEMRCRGLVDDTLLLLEHPHVFTLGRGAPEVDILQPELNVPVYRISRGGQATYHGPGQLIGYPIIKLDDEARDVHAYLRALEEVIIGALRDYGINSQRRAGLTGVWVGVRKIASIGVGIRRWVTMHGFAVNVSADLRYFSSIVPCGIPGCLMTSLAAEGVRSVSIDGFAQSVAAHFARVFGYRAVAPIEPAAFEILHGCGATERSQSAASVELKR
jgi:lipoyl(octanoyl) transferase